MAQTGYSPILIYGSTTTGNTPAAGNLTTGTSGVELAINATDGKLFYKDNAGVVQTIATKAGAAGTFSNVTITGGSINGTTIGATTASTGAFTTLSASSTVSGTGFSTYLASPPAIGSTAANTGAFTTLSASGTTTLSGGTANGVAYLNGSKVVTTGSALTFVGGALLNTGSFAPTDGTNIGEIKINSATLDFNTSSSAVPQVFRLGSSEQMRLTSTGLGIGTSSPADILTLAGGASGAYGLTINNAKAGGGTKALFQYDATNQIALLAGNTTNGLAFQTLTSGSLTTKVTLDSSGNLGLGVTPSAWRSGALSYDVARSSYADDNGTLTLASNAYRATSNWIYKVSTFATRMDSDSGQFRWYTAPSGTAGNAITFTQAMTLDASGNLAVGLTSPSGKLHVNNTGIGQLVIAYNGTSVNYYDADTQIFRTGGATERARIDNSGNLLVGKTAVSLANNGFVAQANGYVSSSLSGTTSATDSYNLYSTGASAYRFYVDMAGTIHATSIVITAISDERLKENVRNIDTGLNDVLALKPRRFDWKEGKGQDRKNVAGFIAQEFEEVFPECIGTTKAGADGIEYKNINYETLIPTLVKAIQEQQALIQTLTDRITALEGK